MLQSRQANGIEKIWSIESKGTQETILTQQKVPIELVQMSDVKNTPKINKDCHRVYISLDSILN